MTKINPIEVQKFLKGVDYPASKFDLLDHVQREGADEDVRSALEQLPEETFDTPASVSKAVGKID